MSNADSYNSDDERYANDTFEQESDTDAPEVAEIESEISEVSDEENDDGLQPVKINNTGTIRRNLNFPNVTSAPINTDSVPFDSSSDEEDDVIVGQTLVEINTPSTHYEEFQSTSSIRRYENNAQHKSFDDQSGSSVSEEEEANSEEEKELQRIAEMEESYVQKNSAKTPKANTQNSVDSFKDVVEEQDMKSPTEDASNATLAHNGNSLFSEREIDPIPEVMENFTTTTNVAPPQIQTDFIEIIQNSLSSLQATETGELINTNDTEVQDLNATDPIRMTFSFEPNEILSPENITMAFFNAMSATQAAFSANNPSMAETIPSKVVDKDQKLNNNDSQYHSEQNSCKRNYLQKGNSNVTDMDDQRDDKEVELEELDYTSQPPVPDDVNDDDESYYDTQFEYQITSKTPSCFNSEDYVFHANLIRPTPTTDKLRPRPHPRKSMSFSNERMREIERHNQILLRKILTQKPTYVLKSVQQKAEPKQTTSQTSARLTTSALNRKKQQRQIEMDNQVLRRKLEAIAIRRRPLIS